LGVKHEKTQDRKTQDPRIWRLPGAALSPVAGKGDEARHPHLNTFLPLFLAGASGFPLNSASISAMVGRLPWNSAGRVSVICFFPSEKIRVFEDLRGHVGFRRWHGDREIVQGLSGAEVELALDLNFQDAAAPSVGDRLADLETEPDCLSGWWSVGSGGGFSRERRR
jgi:hypothetical protein